MQVNFGMYTAKGNAAVSDIVARARRNFWTWPQTLAALEQVSRNHPDLAGEATDTSVREIVYDTLGYTSNFYAKFDT